MTKLMLGNLMMLSAEDLSHVVRLTPLVSIDLLCRNRAGEVLLGWRLNEPAKGTWFVPGGRIGKDERLSAAYSRICLEELGLSLGLDAALFKGVFEHFYPTNFANKPGFGTHYVVLAYELELSGRSSGYPTLQHASMRWWGIDELLAAEQVHPNTKAYWS